MQIGGCVQCKFCYAAGPVFGKCKERPQSRAGYAQRDSIITLLPLLDMALEFLDSVWLRDVEHLNIFAGEAVDTDSLASAG